MPVSPTIEILRAAKEEGRGIGAFNIVNMTQMMAIRNVVDTLKYPTLMQTSVATATFYSPELIVGNFKKIAETTNIPMAIHLDHCRDLDFAKNCAKAGYNSIMVDFSKEPYKENIEKTLSMVEYCRDLGNVVVEGEVGIIPGVEDEISSSLKEEFLCTPEVALDFVQNTGVDFFAPAIGTAHGIYKTKNPHLDFDRLRMIDELLKSKGFFIPLVVHGGSGLPEKIVKKLIKSGASKFNVSTDIKQNVLAKIREHLNTDIYSNNTLEIERITKSSTYESVKKWMTIFVEN